MRRWWLGAATAVVVIAAVIAVAFVVVVHGRTSIAGTAIAAPGTAAHVDSMPAAAATTCRQLVSGTATQQRGALTPELASTVPGGALFPPGSHLALDATSWHDTGAYANVTGVLSAVGQPNQHVEIGLVQRDGRWLVTFEEALS